MKILLTSAGRRSYIVHYFKEALKGQGEIHASNSVWSPALEFADKAVITPIIYDDSYIHFILEYCLTNNISAILSLFDIDLPILSKSKDLFKKNGIELLVSDFEVTQICNDKWRTYNFLINNGILTPKTFISLQNCLESIAFGQTNFPLVIKPRWGMGSIGIYVADNRDELAVLFKKTKNEILNSYLKYESASTPNESIIIQEMLSGVEYGLDIINDLKKDYITTLVKRKTAMRAGETDSAITENNSILRETGETISKHLGHILNLDVDCFIDKVNKPYVLEMNCRFGGHYPFSHLAGANLPLAIVKWISGKVVEKSLFDIEYGIEGYKEIVIKRKTLGGE
ncbi:MAG: ATP-grasp domain-containing protein [Bacteroidales bacterium]